ncbi:hypothetical protein KGA66_17595 [Actinocrinis puniceicyclus]|uniref:DUF624 domain-containing protein n=1 Tax=Actinocrinis puniceicyclus TaxID=977794 RepID=A0A8J7WM39_9ACTN|nr:hypothetical protein [Actinocrinis puniceicyclus]MBS2964876.1 hypothetical protein [Actinocrinis puniceicyclus]
MRSSSAAGERAAGIATGTGTRARAGVGGVGVGGGVSGGAGAGVSARTRREFGEGPLARASALIYSLLVIELLLLVTTLPGLIPLVLLDRDASNAPLAVACALPLGPALSAALFALRQHKGDLTDLKPAAAFRRGYRLNAGGALRVWIPWLALMAVLAVNLSHPKAAAVPGWWSALLVAFAAVATLWVANALVITSLFAFRPIDVARLAAYFLGRTKSVTVGNVCLLICAGTLVRYASEAVLALFGVLFAAFLLRNARAMIALVTEEFTA